MASGLKLVRKELGPDALILSTRTVRNGKLGLLGKPTIEITAAIDTPWPKEENTSPRRKSGSGRKTKPEAVSTRAVPTGSRINLSVGDNDDQPEAPPTGPDISTTPEVRQMLASRFPAHSPPDDTLRSEVDELKGLVQQLAGRIAELHDAPEAPPGEHLGKGGRHIEDVLRSRLAGLQPLKDPVALLLADHGIVGESAATIAGFTRENLPPHDLADTAKIRAFVIQAIENLLEISPPVFSGDGEQQRIALIGPTGVGKTTTLAKLAAYYLANYSNSIALITIDTYRIAAVEQLKVYGEIMHLPVEVVISPEQLEESLARHADKSLVLIDTAGRSPKDTLCIHELTSFLKPELNIEKHLVLSAATRENELLDTIEHFSQVGIDRTIFTKIDECSRNGVILSVQIRNSAPLSYITNGQRVPEDLLQITRTLGRGTHNVTPRRNNA